MDGVLVIDKAIGPTSHDVVARVRRALRERRVGHTGTLDPAASGVLPLVIGRATRLARFLSTGDKAYDAVIRLGFSTTTQDAQGSPLAPPYQGPLPTPEAIEQALDAFRGTFLQQPPAYSAKMIDGHRSYKLARRQEGDRSRIEIQPTPVPHGSRMEIRPTPVPQRAAVTTRAVELRSVERDRVALHVVCSAGFYVRSLAHDLGERLGTGAHLVELRRTKSGEFTLADARPLDDVDRHPDEARQAIIPLAHMLTGFASVTLTVDGTRHAVHGRVLGPADFAAACPSAADPWIRLLDEAGDLVGVGRTSARPGVLHPSVVLR